MAKKEKKGLTRRSFMKRTGVAGAGLAAAGPASKLLGNKSLESLFGPDTAAAADLGEKGGYTGKMLFVDIHGTGIETWTEPTSKYAKKFLGARGIHEWLLFNHVPTDADAFDPENLLCLGAGPFNGTLFPGASRLEITTINANTGGTSHANSGSDVCSEMKYAGYDNIIISGKADVPSYLYIEDDNVELRDASHLWGRDPIEARNIVRAEVGDRRICAVGIGVAGENLSRIACIQGDAYHTHGGIGCGGVMGSKNLKLICVRGHGSVKVSDPEKFKETIDPIWESRGLSPFHWLETWAGGNTLKRSLARLRNSQWLGPAISVEEMDTVNQKGMDDHGYTGRRYTCRHCVNANHGTFYKITDGPHKGVKSKWHMTCHVVSWFGLQDPNLICADLINWIYLGDSLGFNDTLMAPTISWAFECYQRGLLTKKDTDGMKLDWVRDKGPKNNEIIFQVMDAMAHRRGELGELLADGAWEACKKLLEKDGGVPRVDADGKTPEYYIIGTKKNVVCKDQARGGHRGPYGVKWLFACALSIRGGMHADGSAGSGPGPDTMTPEEYADMTNGNIYEEAGRFTSYNDWLKEVYDALGQCLWAIGFSHTRVDVMATALNSATGSNYTGDSLMNMGRKLFNIAKAINTIRKGFIREHDTPLPRVLEPLPPPNDPFHLDIDQWNEQLDKYYDFHGWDRDTSWQKRSTLTNLGLSGVAMALWREGKLK